MCYTEKDNYWTQLMSTNFYLRMPDTPEGEEGLHIGLSTSHGRFLFEAHPKLDIRSVEDWKNKFLEGDIFCEYGRPYTPEEFLAFVDDKQAEATSLRWWEATGATLRSADTRFVDPQGYSMDAREFC